jgi:hypothetical protein
VTETDIKNAAGSAREGAEHQAARTAVRGLRYLPFLHRLPGVKWMATRLAALPVLAQALRQHHGDPAACTAFVRPVLFTFGSLTNPRWRVMRDRLQNYFPAFTSQEFKGLHRLNTSHQAEPDRTPTSTDGVRAESARVLAGLGSWDGR